MLFACLDCLDKPAYVAIVAGTVSKPKNFRTPELMNRPRGILPIAVTAASKAFCGRRNRVGLWSGCLLGKAPLHGAETTKPGTEKRVL